MKTIPLTQGHIALVDDNDYDYLMQFKWHYRKSPLDNSGYVSRVARGINGNKTSMSMHRDVMGCTFGDKLIVDHMDRNGLNNQKSNLRFATCSQNAMNRQAAGMSKYLGVHILKRRRKTVGNYSWRSAIKVDGTYIFLGTFPFTFAGEKMAAMTYNMAAKKHYGEFAKLNDI